MTRFWIWAWALMLVLVLPIDRAFGHHHGRMPGGPKFPVVVPVVPVGSTVYAPPIPAIAAVMPALPNPRFPAARLAQINPEQAKQSVTLGNRLFRVGNLQRSAERFKQASRAEPRAAAPWVGLAQIALVRGNYSEAAAHFRRAQAAQPNWLINAPDVERIYAEPADFGAAIARLETHLQAHPNDRDAWLVLGAQMYLTGRVRKAADIFARLNDRQPDATLAAFLEATEPNGGIPR